MRSWLLIKSGGSTLSATLRLSRVVTRPPGDRPLIDSSVVALAARAATLDPLTTLETGVNVAWDTDWLRQLPVSRDSVLSESCLDR